MEETECDAEQPTPDSETLNADILPPVQNVETKLFKAIIKCIKYDNDVKALDTLRKWIKTQKLLKHNKQYNENMKHYRVLPAKVKRKIVLQLSEHQKSITNYEKDYFAKTGRTCSKDEEIWMTLIRKKNYASNLLQNQFTEEDIHFFEYIYQKHCINWYKRLPNGDIMNDFSTCLVECL